MHGLLRLSGIKKFSTVLCPYSSEKPFIRKRWLGDSAILFTSAQLCSICGAVSLCTG